MTSIEMDASPEARIRQLGLTLPAPAKGLGNYEPWTIVGNTFMTSGQFPWSNGDDLCQGRLGKEISLEQGYAACRLATLNAIAQLHAALAGNYNRLKKIYRLEGVLNVADGCFDHPAALDGASDALLQIFGERGRHTRMIWTNPVLPRNAFCLVYIYAEIIPLADEGASQ